MRKIMMWSAWFWLVFAAQGAFAAEIEIKQFQAGDVIFADDVNGNFQALSAAMQQIQTLLADLETRNAALEKKNHTLETEMASLKNKIAALEKQLSASPNLQKSESQAIPGQTSKPRLRTKPMTIQDYAQGKKIFGLDDTWHLRQYIENDFEKQDDTVIDHTTGLMWQQSGSGTVNYKTAQSYIEYLNQNRFAGYSDWRLPTIEELLSLVEQRKSDDMYIDSHFDLTQRWGWSSDKLSSGDVLYVNFVNAQVNWDKAHATNFVRAVRSLQP